ncbi:hypothetical protein GTA08_BOTSDO09533 [Neofusicoccum parvum]|uniref:Uncharacterized protein n=1 Tax=Neofusicoccum parvum TaxID=310453 RepID=A0ACB5S918_9PEZI|nr:hypothetical protein GTA08_BOTSDO09533 [Neofusicoccum parvum]
MSSRTPIPLSKALSPDECNAEVSGASLAGRNALITGGASGLGAAIALAYAEKGAYVTLVDRNERLGTEYASELRNKGFHAQFIPADVTSWPSQVAAFKAAITFHPDQRLDIVVASAGMLGEPFVTPDEPAVSLTADPPRPRTDAWEVNTIGLAFTAKLAQLYFDMPAAAGAAPAPAPKSLVLLASLAPYIVFPLAAAYTSSKDGARGVFKNVRAVFARRGHRCNMIAPWIIRTPMTDELIKTFEALGAPGGDVGQAVRAAMRFADDPAVNGRSWAVGLHKIFDMGDDREGGNGEAGLKEFFTNGMPQWDSIAEQMLAGV